MFQKWKGIKDLDNPRLMKQVIFVAISIGKWLDDGFFFHSNNDVSVPSHPPAL